MCSAVRHFPVPPDLVPLPPLSHEEHPTPNHPTTGTLDNQNMDVTVLHTGAGTAVSSV